jgi:DNA-binding NarL/FixJ family response regulator
MRFLPVVILKRGIMTKILIIDPHPMTCKGLNALLKAEKEFEVICRMSSNDDALTQVETHQPDLVILDVDLPGTNGISFIKQLRREQPNVSILVFTDRKTDVMYTIRAGARGYVSKRGEGSEIVKAIRQVLAGKVYVSEKLCDKLLLDLATASKPSPPEILSERELEVFELIGRGKETRAIATRLGVSPKTIDSYKRRIRTKLDLGGNSELIQRAVRWTSDQDAT